MIDKLTSLNIEMLENYKDSKYHGEIEDLLVKSLKAFLYATVDYPADVLDDDTRTKLMAKLKTPGFADKDLLARISRSGDNKAVGYVTFLEKFNSFFESEITGSGEDKLEDIIGLFLKVDNKNLKVSTAIKADLLDYTNRIRELMESLMAIEKMISKTNCKDIETKKFQEQIKLVAAIVDAILKKMNTLISKDLSSTEKDLIEANSTKDKTIKWINSRENLEIDNNKLNMKLKKFLRVVLADVFNEFVPVVCQYPGASNKTRKSST